MSDEDASPSGLPSPRGLRPASCHCQVLRQAARRATGLYDTAMAPFGLRISQFGILVRLRRSGPMGLQALAIELVLDRTTLGRNLRALERDGLVASEMEPADRRVRRLVITRAGEAMVEAAMPAWREAQAEYERRYGAAQADALRATLLQLTASLGGVGAPAPE